MTSTQKLAVGIFLLLLFLCGGLLIAAEFLGPTVREALLPIAGDGFKVVIGALVGALSAILGVQKGAG